jgi:hypothetical protein
MSIQIELLPGLFRTEHFTWGKKTIIIDNYSSHLKRGFSDVITATKEYIKYDNHVENKSHTTTTAVMLHQSVATDFIQAVISAFTPIFDFYKKRLKDANITLFNIRMVTIHVVLDELFGEEDTWKAMLPYTRISKLTKYGIHLRNFIEDILRYMVAQHTDLKLDIAGMDLYKISTHILVHTNNDFQPSHYSVDLDT